jgi:threonine dehydrogenase-like Zn-dependent dehydrogenase
MKAVLITGVNKLEIGDVPVTPMQDYHARVRVVSGSICNSTDRKLLEGTFPGCTNFPAVLGHEVVAEVVDVGSKVRNYRPGDLVFRPFQYFAEDAGFREYFGAFATDGLVTDQWAMMEDDPSIESGSFGHPQQVLPAGTDPTEGVLAITLKETMSWIRRAGVSDGWRVVVFGTGPVGTAFCMFARMAGASQVILAGRTRTSIERAAAICGPDDIIDTTEGRVPERIREMTCNEGANLVVEGVGDNAIIDMGLQCLSPDGYVGVYGVPPSTQAKAAGAEDARVRPIVQDESEVHDEYFQMVADGKIDPARFMSHRLPWDKIGGGFDLLKSREAFKVVLDW